MGRVRNKRIGAGRCVAAFGLALLLPANPAQGEEVLLVNGTSFSGRILSQTSASVKIRTAGGVRTLSKRQIARISYVKFTAAQKQAQRAKFVQAVAAYRERIRRLRAARMEAAERQRQMQAAEAGILEEKKKEARKTAERAAALRELKEQGKFENDIEEPISYRDFAWRSLLLPGWGHFYLDKPVMGSFYLVGVAGLAGYAYERRRVALKAVNRNHRQAEQNLMLAIWPDFADRDTRIFLSHYANAKAFTHYTQQVDDYHNSLYALQGFYLFQLAHIIYNGIAWENGLLIVEDDAERRELRPRLQMAFLPDLQKSSGEWSGQKLRLMVQMRF